MCGFTGYFDPSFEHDQCIIEEMTNQIISRGPDSYGIHIDKDIGISLGHRRLSIQDLSENGSQPMLSNSKRYTLAFNGEIYNHFYLRKLIEKKSNIQIWKGTSDTETLLSLVENFDIEESLSLINGMYAFVILDNWDQKLYLCRDRFGEKPLYYGLNNGVLFFGSQPKSFKPHPKWSSEICSQGLNQYFVKGYIGERYSIYKGIYKLLPASFISIDLQSINLSNYKTYWRAENKNINFLDSQNLIIELDKKIENAVKSKIISDRKIGSFLSGGIDSSLITYYLQKQFSTPIDTFTIGFEDLSFDESESARRISKYLGTNHHEEVFTTNHLIDLIPKLPQIYDEPFSDPSQLPTLLLSQLTTKNVKVAFSGDGGDELFCGYTRYNTGYKLNKLIKNSPKYLIYFYQYLNQISRSELSVRILKKLPDRIRPNSLIDRSQKLDRLLKVRDIDFYSLITSIFIPENEILINKKLEIKNNCESEELFEDYREYMINRDIKEYLPDDILTKVDRASMFNGLEVRVPFLDHEFASWAQNIPISLKTYDGNGKWPLRKLLSNKIPSNLFKKPKKGFGIPVDKIVNDTLKEMIYEFLSKENILNQGIFNFSYIEKLLDQNYYGKEKLHNQIWNIFIFQIWYYENF